MTQSVAVGIGRVIDLLNRAVLQGTARARRRGYGRLRFNQRNQGALARSIRRVMVLAGTEARKFYKRQLIRDIDVTTKRRTGRLRRPRVRKSTRGDTIKLVEDFPHTFKSNLGGQYAYVVDAPRGGNRKFIRHAKGVTNANLRQIFARAFARQRKGHT